MFSKKKKKKSSQGIAVNFSYKIIVFSKKKCLHVVDCTGRQKNAQKMGWMASLIIHIAFILIYAPWPTKKTTVAHYWAMAHRLKTPGLDQNQEWKQSKPLIHNSFVYSDKTLLNLNNECQYIVALRLNKLAVLMIVM